MDILIVSKTQMKSGVCVGGITVEGEFVRLLDSNGHNQPSNCQYQIGQIYDVLFQKSNRGKPPHIEDILCGNATYKKNLAANVRMIDFLNEKNVFIHTGSIDCLFNNSLKYTSNNHGYIDKTKIPPNSVAFWIVDKDLIKMTEPPDSKYYKYDASSPRLIKYVGLEAPPAKIPHGTLVRVSLARWWSPDLLTVDERCYLQLSGWYK